MLEIMTSPDHVGAYRLSGTLTEEDYDRLTDDLEARLLRHERIGILADLTGFHDISIRAGIKDLRYSFSKLFELRRFPKEALITDKHWVKTLALIANPLVPFVKIRAFGADEQAPALAWVSDLDSEA
jgi:hypothetical protein